MKLTRKGRNMADNFMERCKRFLFPQTSDEEYDRYTALGGEVLDVGGDGGPLIEGYPELTDEERAKLPEYALAAHLARVRFDRLRGEIDEEE